MLLSRIKSNKSKKKKSKSLKINKLKVSNDSILELFTTSSSLNTNKIKSKKNNNNNNNHIDTEKLKELHKYPIAIFVSLNKKSQSKKKALDSIIDNFVKNKKIGDSLRSKLHDENKLKLDRITQNISHNLSTYINKTFFNFNKVKGVSNAYLKLWEIYQTLGNKIITSITKSKSYGGQKPSFLHMCEAPGNWIKSTRHYMMRFHPSIRYTWFANSLNPANDEVKRVYGRVFQDELEYMRKYPTQWLFGSDNTGDITRPDNISHIAKMVRKSSNNNGVALITGDAGLDKDTPVEILQKLEVAQFIMSIACNIKDGCCIIKNFASSYGPDSNKMKGSIDYLVSLIKAYQHYYNEVIIMKPVTSNPISSEYYLIGIGFKGVSKDKLEEWYSFLSKFKPDMSLNECLKIENSKNVDNIEEVLGDIYELNNKSDEILIVLMECFLNKNITIKNVKASKECNNYLDNSIKFEKELFKQWIKRNKYAPISF